jgi:hypothetical protein
MKAHDAFFGHIISMIPRDLYKPDEEAQDELNSRFFKHRQMPLGLSEKKAISQKKKEEKYGVKSSSADSEDDVEVDGNNDVEEEEDDDADGEDEGGAPKTAQERIRARIAELEKARKGSGKKQLKRSAENLSKAQKREKAKPNQLPQKTPKQAELNENESRKRKSISDEALEQHLGMSLDDVVGNNEPNIEFNDVFDGKKKHEDSGKPGSKMRRLKRMLDDAESKRRRIEELKGQGNEGKEQAMELLWGDALKDAVGAKSVTDTTKLRKAIKKREKSKEKSAREWQNRLDNVNQTKQARIEKREKNLTNRKNGGAVPVEPTETSAEGEGKKKGRMGGREGKYVSEKYKGKKGGDEGEGGKNGSTRAGFEGKSKTQFLNRN